MSNLKRALFNGPPSGKADQDLCYTMDERPFTLCAKTGHEEWFFPWMYFVRGRQCLTPGSENLVLLFGRDKVAIQGHNLNKLGEIARKGRLETIREICPGYEPTDAEPWIAKIVVTEGHKVCTQESDGATSEVPDIDD